MGYRLERWRAVPDLLRPALLRAEELVRRREL